MASPFRVFRKHQKALMVVAGVICMFVFVIGDALMGYLGVRRNGGPSGARAANAVAVRWDGGSLTNAEVEQLKMRRQVTNAFLEEVEGRGMQAAYLAGVEPTPLRVQTLRGPVTSQQGVENSVVQTHIFAKAARDAGMNVSDDTIVQYLDELGRRNVSRADMRAISQNFGKGGWRVSIDSIIDALREEMLARNFHASHRFAFETVTPEQRWEDWLSVNDRIVVEAAAIPAESRLIDVKEPTEAELTEFFEKYKKVEPQPDPNVARQLGVELPLPIPAFATPRKIDAQFIEANFEEFLAKAENKITDEEISKFYEENKQLFPKSKDVSLEDATSVEEGVKDDAAATDAAETEKPVDTTTPATEQESAETTTSEGETTENPEATTEPPAENEAAPAGENPPPATEPDAPPEEGDQSSLDRSKQRGVFRLAAFLQDAESTEAAPNSEPPTEPAASVPAEDAAAEAPATEPAAPDSPPAAQEYEPLENVRDLIRSDLARVRASENMAKVMDQVAAEISAEFNTYFGKVLDAQSKKEEPPAPPAMLADLAPLAEKHGLKAGKTGPMSMLEMRETPVGKSGRVDSGALLLALFFGGGDEELYQPISTFDNDRNRYVVMKTSDTPGRVPELKDMRDEVIRAWKMQEAGKLALDRAKELAKKAQDSGSTLTDFFADDKSITVVKTDPFSQLTGGDVAFVGGQYQQQPFRLSQPDGIVAAGPEFISKAFELKDKEVGAVFNHDHSIAYVVRVAEHAQTPEQLHQDYLTEANTWDGIRLKTQARALQSASQLFADLSPNFKWERTPDDQHLQREEEPSDQ